MLGRRGRSLVAIATLAAGVSVVGPVGHAAADSPATCRDYRVPVSSLPGTGNAGEHHIAGTLCMPAGRSPDTVQLLIPGGTYNHTYWDFPVPGYSYARAAAARGQATFNIDRFNTGRSSDLPPALVTVDVDAAAVHQVIEALRAGGVGGVRFSRVVTVGHSVGSMVAIQEAATYHDVDGLILSAFTNYPSADLLAGLATFQLLVPARNEPLGEMTTAPGARGPWFHAEDNADQAVIAKDEATKDTITASEMATMSVPMLTLPTNLITAPVLIANGQHDRVFACVTRPCDDTAMLRRTEVPRFTSAASLDAFVLPGAGHSVNLARNRDEFFDVATAWVERHVG
ncbi:MAG: alpha/beta fold hydrolase [Streptosporangiales bacterium]|nr:alpha/beta fold hydrolase [Streptosporangiales bacterium]